MLKKILRLTWCVLGAMISLSLAFWVVYPDVSPIFMASIGGTAIFLFGLTRAPAAQPRAVFGGHIGGALIGIICVQTLGTSMMVHVLACALTMIFMLLARATHPPAGATPLIMVHENADLLALTEAVGLSLLILFLVVVIWSRIIPGMPHYPIKWMDKSPPKAWWGDWNDDEV
jgi:CBS-domain-containing membrane protein